MDSETTVNPNVFSYELNGKSRFADPMKVRRVLLDNTMGKCWGIVREVRNVKTQIETQRDKLKALEDDLEKTPTTPEELAKLAEIQQAQQDQKQVTMSFEELPRIQKLDSYTSHIALLCDKQAKLEAILSNASYEAFELPEFNMETGEGVTEFEAIEILIAFLEYAEGKGNRLGV